MTKGTLKPSPSVHPAPRLGLHTCEDLLEKLRWEHGLPEKQWDSQFLAFNFAITANHLYADWIKNAGSHAQRSRVNQLPDIGKKLFTVWRDTANASKHWKLNKNNGEKQVVSKVSQPQISDWYAYFIAGPVLYLTVEDAKPSLPELAEVTIQCFEWILESDLFPEIRATGLMRFPDNQWIRRSQNEEALQRRADHQGDQAPRIWREG